MEEYGMFRILFAAMAGITGAALYNRWKRGRVNGDVANEDPPVNADQGRFLFRQPSFSLIALKGAENRMAIDLLKRLEYGIDRLESKEGKFEKIIESLNDNTAQKALFNESGYAVLLDPEMVVIAHEEELAGFARKHNTKVLCALWERFSETIMFKVYGEEGIEAGYRSQEGEVDADAPMNPPRVISENPTPEGLLAALAESGLPLSLTMRLDAQLIHIAED